MLCQHQVLHRLGMHMDLGLEELALGWVTHPLIHTYCWSKNRDFPGKQLSLCGEFSQELPHGSVLSSPQEKERCQSLRQARKCCSSEPPGALAENAGAIWVGLVLFKLGHTCSRNSQRTPHAPGSCGISALHSFLLLRMSQFDLGRRFWEVQGSVWHSKCCTAPCAFHW